MRIGLIELNTEWESKELNYKGEEIDGSAHNFLSETAKRFGINMIDDFPIVAHIIISS